MRTAVYLATSLLLLLAYACEVDRDYVTGDAVALRFSTDTLRFDTVFTARGSATRMFKVYNDAAEPVQIDRIEVAGETGVDYTFNADGTAGPAAGEVVIFGRDSIFVFVEVEVDPSEPVEVSPFIATDRLVFHTGSTQRSVVLEAFGQNANYLNGFNRGTFFQPICAGGTFTLPTDLPTVIYGSMFVDSCVLRVLAGTRIYFHGGVQRNPQLGGSGIFSDGFIYTLPGGRLELLGTREEPILLATDRLEPEYEQSAGGYRGLVLGPGSRGNRIEHTTIRNSIVGVTVDSLADLTIENSVVAYSSGPALLTYQGDVTATNTLIHSSRSNAVQVLKGGSLVLDHVTIANYGSTQPALSLENCAAVPDEGYCLAAPLYARITNSIVAGGSLQELYLFDVDSGQVQGSFDLAIGQTVVRTDDRFLRERGGLYADFYATLCTDCHNLQYGDALFASVAEDDFRLDSLSVARDLGVYLPELPLDLAGNARDTESPDAGALEWQPGG